MTRSDALTFTLKEKPAQRVDLSPLSTLTELSIEEIKALPLFCGKRQLRLEELFEVAGDDRDHIIIQNSCDKLDSIGLGLERGEITVEGDAGAYLGMRMKGGKITVYGNTGIFTACEMKGGLIKINDNAGDFLGAALPGDKKGMGGGTVIVRGDAGERVGDHMRRGVILIEGNAGAYCGSRMTAGTIAVMGETGAHLGYAMRRGTLLLWQKPKIPPTFNDCGQHTLSFLPLLFASFKALDSKLAQPEVAFNRAQRYGGDMATIGRGEILVRV